MADALKAAFDELSTEEQILRLQDLWDTLSSDSDNIAVTPNQRAELDRRIARHETHPEETIAWEDLCRGWRNEP